MKKVLLLSTVIFCLIINACSDDNSASTSIEVLSEVSSSSISDDSSSSSTSEDPLPGDTSALLKTYDCENIFQRIPIQPPSPNYNLTVLDTGVVKCAIVFPDATDSLTVLNYLNELSIYHHAYNRDSTIFDLMTDIRITFYLVKEKPNQLNYALKRECRNAAHVFNLLEKDSLWIVHGDYCYMQPEKIPITDEEFENIKQALTADGWKYLGCRMHFDKSPLWVGCDFVKKIGDLINDYTMTLMYDRDGYDRDKDNPDGIKTSVSFVLEGRYVHGL
jgi:hypothetical protein